MRIRPGSPTAHRWGKVSVAVSLALLLGAGFLTLRTAAFLARAVTVDGQVTALIPQRSDEGGLTHRTAFRFRDAAGRVHRGETSWGSQPPSHAVGERVRVAYDPAQPEGARLHAFPGLWTLPLFLLAFAFVEAAVAAALLGRFPWLMERMEVAAEKTTVSVNGLPR